MRCGSCAYDNRADSVYCGQCRAALTRPCPACGEPAPTGAAACLACGASLTATVPLPGGGWQGAPGESTAVYGPADLAGVGMAGGGLGADGGETRFTGVARDVQQRQDEHWLYVDFRIERHDPSGNRLAPVPVEMRGATHLFAGRVSNGDEIRVVDGTWRHGTLRVRELDNLTTGARVRSSRYTEAQLRQARIRFVAVLITIIGGFFLLSHFRVGWAIAPVIVIAFVYLFIGNSRRLLKGCSGRADDYRSGQYGGCGLSAAGGVRPGGRMAGGYQYPYALIRAQVAPRLLRRDLVGLLVLHDLFNAGLSV